VRITAKMEALAQQQVQIRAMTLGAIADSAANQSALAALRANAASLHQAAGEIARTAAFSTKPRRSWAMPRP